MALHSNWHKKPRRTKGTPMFVFRYYVAGGVFAVSGLFYLALQ